MLAKELNLKLDPFVRAMCLSLNFDFKLNMKKKELEFCIKKGISSLKQN